MNLYKSLAFAAGAGLISMSTLASADVYTYDFASIVTGSAPGGSAWATLTISDNGLDNVLVRLDHNATSTAGQFITDLWFNLAPYVAVSQVNATPSNKFNGFTASQNGVGSAGVDFDLNQSFKTSNAGGGVDRLKPGEFVTFELSGSGLNAADFNSLSQGNGDYYAMIHLQGIPGGQSVKLAPVPEPATMGVLGLGLAALLRRKKGAKKV